MTTLAPPREITRDRVLRLADGLFAAHGYAAVSMREVALAAGVTKPALYYHFRDKEALFEECVLADCHHLHRLLVDAVSREVTLCGRVEAIALVLLTGSAHHPVRTQADIVEHLPAESRRRLGQAFDDCVAAPVTELFAEAERRGELRTGVSAAGASLALMGVAMAYTRSMAGRDDGSAPARERIESAAMFDAEHVASVVADLVLGGIASNHTPMSSQVNTQAQA